MRRPFLLNFTIFPYQNPNPESKPQTQNQKAMKRSLSSAFYAPLSACSMLAAALPAI
jgi:hypothetical protein